MNKVSVVLYYWIAMAAALLFAKVAGLADNDVAIIKIIVIVTILYVGIVMTIFSRAKKMAEQDQATQMKKSTKKSSKK